MGRVDVRELVVGAAVYWVMVGVIAVVVFGVAAVASGQGGEMAPAYPDRPDTGLPPGPVGAAELGSVLFGVGLRGYRMDEVDEVLDRVTAELEARDARIADLEWRLAATDRDRDFDSALDRQSENAHEHGEG